ncbi:sodium:solute symporter [Bacillus carboniphilus]|uniref:Sodium:solute symporter n=1 Tax=Bacillus carboniphilus TaxID=86663 RepID=A0ABN0VWH7_9BACI
MNEKTRTKITYGYGLFTILLISRWSTGNTLFASPESLLRFGFSGGIVFALAGCFSFFALIPLVQRVRTQTKHREFLPLLEERLTERAFLWTKRIMVLAVYFGMIGIGLAVGLLLYAIFYIPVPIGVALFFLFGWLLVVIGNLEWFTNFNVMKVGLLLLLMVMMLIHAFLFDGTEPVYKGVRLYHPYLFFIEFDQILPLLTAFWLAILGNMLMDGKMWGVLLKANKTRFRRGLFITGLVWTTIPFGFTMMVLASIYKGGFDSIFTVFEKMLHRYDSWPITTILFFVLFVILLDTFWTQVRSLHMLKGAVLPKKVNQTLLLLVILLGVVPAIIYYQSITLLDLFFIFGSYYASTLPVFGFIFWRNQRVGLEGPIIVGVGTIVGWACYCVGMGYVSVIMAFMTAFGLMLVSVYGLKKGILFVGK